MKTLNKFLLLLCVMPTLCLAHDNYNSNASNNSSEIPQTAKLLYPLNINGADSSKESLMNLIIGKIQEKESRIDIDLQCKAVYYDWSFQSNTECYVGSGWGPGGCFNPFNQVFGSSKFYTSNILTVNAYCDPRAYNEKVIASLQRSCEQKPEVNCLDEKVMEAFRSLQPTLRIDINKP